MICRSKIKRKSDVPAHEAEAQANVSVEGSVITTKKALENDTVENENAVFLQVKNIGVNDTSTANDVKHETYNASKMVSDHDEDIIHVGSSSKGVQNIRNVSVADNIYKKLEKD